MFQATLQMGWFHNFLLIEEMGIEARNKVQEISQVYHAIKEGLDFWPHGMTVREVFV